MPGSAYGTYTDTDVLGMMVERAVISEIGRTATYGVAAFNALEKKASAKGVSGRNIEWIMNAGDPGRAVNFEVYGTNDGQTAAEPDNKIECQTKNKYTGTHFKISEIKLAEAGGAEAKFEYGKEQALDALHDVKLKLNRNIFYGDPTVSSPDPLGLSHTIAYTGSYGTQTRSTSRALVGNRLDAGNVTTNTGDIASCTITKGSTSVTLGSSKTWSAGDIVTISDGTITRRYYAAAAGSASTSLTITPQLGNEQASTSSATVSIAAPFYKAGQGMGAANAWDLAKVNRAIGLSTDNGESVDCILGDQFQYENFINETLATEDSLTTSGNNELGADSAVGFRYRTAMVQCDNNINPGELYGLNTKYLHFRGTKKFLPLALAGGKLRQEASATPNSFANLLGSYIVSRNLICNGINRQFLITGMTG